MDNEDDADIVLARLPDGARVLSTLLPDQAVLDHVYRVMSESGTILGEFATLVELATFLGRYTTRVSD